MEQFGAKLDSNLYIPYFSGITLHKIPGLKSTNFTPGIIRIPKESKARKRRIGLCKKCKNRIMRFLFSSEGIITNCFIVTIHLLLLILFPLGMLFAVTWSLLQIDNINENIYDETYDITDVFFPSTYNFWLSNLNGMTVFWIIVALSIAFFLSGLVELISFYSTGARDTGKYIVIKSWMKWFFSVTFWILIFLFIGMYSSYMSVILVW